MKEFLDKNLYLILQVPNSATRGEIKKSYYQLSKKYHPDKNPNLEESELFKLISDAYSVLGDPDLKLEYDRKSKFGKDYNELEEFFRVDLDYSKSEADRVKDWVKNKEVLDVIIEVDPKEFNGILEFKRWVICPTCKGTGKDNSSKITIKTPEGKIKIFEADDGCDVCEGTGKDWNELECFYCAGMGRVGLKPCKKCKSEGRIMGKQKLKNIQLQGDSTKVESLGHWNKGRVGNLILIYKK